MRNLVLLLTFLSLSNMIYAQKDVNVAVFNAETSIYNGIIPGRIVLIRPDSITFLYNMLLEKVETPSIPLYPIDSCDLWISTQTGGAIDKSDWKRTISHQYRNDEYNVKGYKVLIMRALPGRYRFTVNMPELSIDTILNVGLN